MLGIAIVVQKAPKTYAWPKLSLSRLCRKMDNMGAKVTKPLLPTYNVFKEIVAAADDAYISFDGMSAVISGE